MSQCTACNYETKHSITIDTSKSKSKWAKELGISETSIRRHLKHEKRETVDEDAEQKREHWSGDEGEITIVLREKISNEAVLRKFGHDPAQVSIVGVLEETHWQMAGVWQHRYRFKTSRAPRGRDITELLQVIEDFEPGPIPAQPLGGTFVVCPSDMQIGKTDWGGGTEDTIKRVMQSWAHAAELCSILKPAEIVIADLGDPIENIYSTSSQRGTNDRAITEQIRVARRLAIEGIKMLMPLAPSLVYAAVPSNHGSVRVGPKSPENHVLDDWGIEIAESIRDVAENAGWGDRFRVVIPEFNYESLVLETSGTKLGMAHGHQANNANGLGAWWRGQSHGRMPLSEADIALFGHFHSLRVEQSGDARWLMVSPAQDNGSSWFTNKTGERSKTGMLSFLTRDGAWSELRIL